METLLQQVKDLPTDEKHRFFQKMCEDLTLGDLVKIVPQLEEAWDVEAKPAMPDWMKQQQQPEEEAEQTEFDVIVTACGAKRIAVVKASRQATGMQLKEANALLKMLPATVLAKADREKAEAVKTQLEDAGATVEIR